MTEARILILDADSNVALSILQSLGAEGHETYLAGSKIDVIGRHSRYCRQFFLYPDPLESKVRFLNWFSELTSKTTFDLIMPVTDITIYPLMEYSNHNPMNGRLYLPPRESFEFFFNKVKTLELAKDCGVPFPKSQLFGPGKDITGQVESFPCYIKPIRSKVWNGDLGIELDAHFSNSLDELEKAYESLSPYSDVLVQNYVHGTGVGIEIFCVNGEVLLSFAHRRIHEYPLTGGGSTYRVSIAMPQTLFHYASMLVKKISWTGVAMVEFKDDGKNAYLMEVNGRFWGSLPLSVRSGVNFPKAVADWELGQFLPKSIPYRVGIYSRKLAMDVAWFKRNLFADKRNPYLLTQPVIQTIMEYFRILSGKEYWDHASWKDPRPILSEIRKTTTRLLYPIVRKAGTLSFLVMAPLIKLFEKRRSKSRLMLIAPRKILIICYGNICRSPFAERLLTNILPKNEFEVKSCGFIQENGRKSPAEIQELVVPYGVTLEGHRSKTIEDPLCRWADVIVIMDAHNWKCLQRFNKRFLEKTVWLGAWLGEINIEIPDPFGEPRERVEMILQKISRSCTKLIEELNSIALSHPNLSPQNGNHAECTSVSCKLLKKL
jgi:protein-tyrosine-phosphatase/predicted ATP-grasp superfamily ATP-dependent carboligase